MDTVIFTDRPPQVTVVGVSRPDPDALQRVMAYRGDTWGREAFTVPSSLAVLAGAGCYRSFGNRAGRTDAAYLQQSIVEHEHFSVLDHVHVNFYVQSVPRSVQLETVRHRIAAYSFLSQRFVDDLLEFVVPPLLRDPEHEEARYTFMAQCLSQAATYRNLVADIDASGTTGERTLRRKRVKEAARGVLGNSVGSDGMITWNAHTIRHVVARRTDPHADASIREFAWGIFDAARAVIPELLQDAVVVPQWGAPQVVFGTAS